MCRCYPINSACLRNVACKCVFVSVCTWQGWAWVKVQERAWVGGWVSLLFMVYCARLFSIKSDLLAGLCGRHTRLIFDLAHLRLCSFINNDLVMKGFTEIMTAFSPRKGSFLPTTCCSLWQITFKGTPLPAHTLTFMHTLFFSWTAFQLCSFLFQSDTWCLNLQLWQLYYHKKD